jgi:hypothetical protein
MSITLIICVYRIILYHELALKEKQIRAIGKYSLKIKETHIKIPQDYRGQILLNTSENNFLSKINKKS